MKNHLTSLSQFIKEASPHVSGFVVYGSAFNPPHRGHVDAMEQLLSRNLGVLAMPSYGHHLKANQTNFPDRLIMARLAIQEAGFDSHQIEVSDLEAQLAWTFNRSQIYSIDVLEFIETVTGVKCKLALGPDNRRPEHFAKFHRHADILNNYGIEPVEENFSARSTQIRDLIMQGNEEVLATLTYRAIINYIKKENLYV